MKKMKKGLLLALCFAVYAGSGYAQGEDARKPGYSFTDIRVMPYTYVKNQDMSGTCWAFSGLSFLESEMMRIGKDSVSLAPMWIVRCAYIEKAMKFVRTAGTMNFTPGGAVCDIFNVIKKYGIVPEEVYRGLNYGTNQHKHSELHAALKGYIGAIAKNPNKGLSTAWMKGFTGILDAYLGPVPEKFTYKGKQYTPQSYAASLGLDMDDYVSFTSFTHHPFYKPFVIEVEDNWDCGQSWNLPMNEFASLFRAALDNGYTIFWDSDVTEGACAATKGWASVPAIAIENVDPKDRDRWLAMNPVEQRMFILNLTRAGKEVEITQELRQNAFDTGATTDDHGMHIVGTAKNQLGAPCYKVKNSWGTLNHPYGGLFYATENYVIYKTICMVVNKNAVPKDIRSKLGL